MDIINLQNVPKPQTNLNIIHLLKMLVFFVCPAISTYPIVVLGGLRYRHILLFCMVSTALTCCFVFCSIILYYTIVFVA